MTDIVGFHHLSLSVSDLGTSTQWYQEVLGLEVTTPEFEGPGFHRTRLAAPASRSPRPTHSASQHARRVLHHPSERGLCPPGAGPVPTGWEVESWAVLAEGVKYAGSRQQGLGALGTSLTRCSETGHG
jgi:catechol 2,3-dioxygenase-like lactoylglutathione lyase family enzyme